MIDTESHHSSSDSGLGGVQTRKQSKDTRSVNEDEDEFELPTNWPDYDFHRKKSCVLNRIFSTCVTKAINHLELVQNAIEEKDNQNNKGAVKREVSFHQQGSGTQQQQLEVVGQGGYVIDQHPHHDMLEDEILEEVLLLLARLDRERLRLINLCEQEQQGRRRLKESIDHWRLKRLEDLPLAVQKEHDACITDITELQWHIAYNTRLAEKMQGKIDLSRTWHRQLEVEVNDIRQKIPLITEKVQTELIEITRIDEALKETEHELMLSRAKNADTLDKFTRSNQRAGTERDEIRAEIDKASKGLQRITTKLQATVDQYKTYEKTISDAKETVKKNDLAYTAEVGKRDAIRSDTASLKLKLGALVNDRERLQYDIEHIKNELDHLRAEEKAREDQRQQELNTIQTNVSKREEKLDKIVKKEREKTTTIDDDERKLDKMRNQIERDKRTLARCDHQRERDAQMLRTVTDNLQRAYYTNDSISTDIKREGEKLRKEEDAIRSTMESIRRQIHDESTMITMLDKQIEHDESELATINEAETARAEQADRVETDLQSRLNNLTDNVQDLETNEVTTKESLGSLRHVLLETNENYVKDKDQLVQTKTTVSGQYDTASTTANELESRLHHIVTETAIMKKHIKDMDEARAMMETLTVKVRTEIQTAESQLHDVNYHYELVEAGEQKVLQALQESLQRQSNTKSMNKQLYQERSNYLTETNKSTEKALRLNKQLASSYRDTLYTYYEIKSRMMNNLEQRLDAAARVKDTRQLIELQKRLHDALNFYFGIKNKYVKQQLDHLNQTSHQNGLQLTHIQENVQSAVDHITHFLVEQVDFEAIHQEAMLKVHREELEQQGSA